MNGELWGAEEFDAEARRLYDGGEFEEALQVLREGIRRHPGAVELHVSQGYTYLALEEYGWARRAFDRALARDPGQEEALVGLGDALLKLGERSRAFLAFERVVELGFGDDPDLMLAAGRALYREELYERALRFYRRAGASAEARAEAGYALYQMGDATAAAEQISAALDARPDLHEARVFYGNLLYDGGEYEEALSHFRRVPAGEMWDPLAVWRTIEMLRGYRGWPSDSDRLRPYLDQLEHLSREPEPEERLLAEVEASRAASGAGHREDRQQLDLFTMGTPAPEGRDPEVHTVRARDGSIYTGDWLSIVRAMRDHSADPSLTIAEYMRETARMLQDLTGIAVPDDDPEAFLKASARAGLLRIER